jgi:hypothetical protein
MYHASIIEKPNACDEVKMKKHLTILSVVILLALLLSACGGSNAADTGKVSSSVEASPTADDAITTQGKGLCSNEFFPIRSDKTWKYTINSGETTSDYSQTFKDITDDAFTSVQTYPNLTNEMTWQCGKNGLLSSTFGDLNINENSDVSVKAVSADGITLPPENEWIVGKVWDNAYTVQVTINKDGNTIQADGQVSVSREIVSQESVTVPAGTYPDAYRVDSTGEMVITLMGTKTSTPLIFSDWYVKGVGLVKSSSTDANTPYDMVLTAFE